MLLQETTPHWERALRNAYSADYPHQDYIAGAGAGGMGVLSRHPFTTREILVSPVGWFSAWLLTVQAPAGAVQVLQVHLKPPYADRGGWVVGHFSTPKERWQEIDAYLPYLDPALPTVVCGDFNERSGPALDAIEALGLRDVALRAPRAARQAGRAAAQARQERHLLPRCPGARRGCRATLVIRATSRQVSR